MKKEALGSYSYRTRKRERETIHALPSFFLPSSVFYKKSGISCALMPLAHTNAFMTVQVEK